MFRETKEFSWTFKITVDPIWVADGFGCPRENGHDALVERVKEAILHHCLGYAAYDEVQVEMLSSPPDEAVLREQGY